MARKTLLTLAEASTRTGIPRKTLQANITRGKLQSTLKTVPVGAGTVRVRYVTEPDLNAWLKSKRKYERKSA